MVSQKTCLENSFSIFENVIIVSRLQLKPIKLERTMSPCGDQGPNCEKKIGGVRILEKKNWTRFEIFLRLIPILTKGQFKLLIVLNNLGSNDKAV